MSDHIRLSLWFDSQPASQVLTRLALAAKALPEAALDHGVRQLTMAAVDWNQPELLQERFDPGLPLAAAIEQMRPFLAADCACELEFDWLLSTYTDSEWRQIPQPIRFTSFGPGFDGNADTAAEDGHLMVDFGLDEAFLAELAPWNEATRRHLQANILQLLALSYKLQTGLNPQRRGLWSESESDWTQKLVRRLQLAEAS